MNDYFSNNVKKEVDKIKIPEEKLERVIESAVIKGKKSPVRKVIYCSCAAVILFALFISSAFVSPTMAKIVNKVPYLNQIIKSMNKTEERKVRLQDFFAKVSNTLSENEEYNGKVDVSMSGFFASDAPTIYIQVENKNNKQERELEKIVNDIAKSYKIRDVKVDIQERHIERHVMSEEDKKIQEVMETAQDTLTQKGYKTSVIQFDSKTNTLSIEVESENTNQHFDQIKKNIEELVSQKQLSYKIEIKKKSESKIKDMNWHPIFTSVMDESHKQFKEVIGFAYSFHPKPLEIILKTSLSNGEVKKAQAIEEYARQVIEIKRKELAVEKIPYKIIIRDKKHKEIYIKSYE